MTRSDRLATGPLADGRTAAKLLEAIANEVTLVDGTGRILSSTAASKGALGYEPSFWETRNVLDLAHPEDVGTAQRTLAELLADPGGSRRERFRARHIDGHWETVEVHGTNLLDDPDIAALVLTTRAVTREERLRAAHAEATRSAELQAEYVASVSHELRSPLQGILGLAELLETEVEGEAAELAGLIRSEGDRLRHVIDDILDYAKITSQTMELDPRPSDIRRLVETVATSIRPQVADGVDVVLDIADEVEPWVSVDDLRLHQVLLNLAANATRFTESGSIALAVERPAAGHLTLSVSDTGAGIAEDRLDEIFQPFRQGEQGDADGSGTGLGLSISHRLIGAMGGKLEVTSALGSGSTFFFTIQAPAATAPIEIAEATPSAPAVGRALIVDDSHVNRAVIGRQLESMGFEVDTAENGLIGVEKATTTRYRLVIMDWHMPELDGLQATERIRAHETTKDYDTLIVAMTASAMPGDREKCLGAGMDDFLAKPATKDQLAEVVALHIDLAEPGHDEPAPAPVDDAAPAADVGAPATPDAAPAPISDAAIDPDVVAALARDLGDPETVAIVVETYLDDLGNRHAAIADALEQGRYEEAGREAHTLKSPSLMLGAMPLGALCRAIEECPTDHDETTLRALAELVEASRQGLATWMAAQ